MGIYGAVEVEYYQITPIGVSKVQSGQLGHIESEPRKVLKTLAELGGTAEIDELKMRGATTSPNVLKVALRQLIDLGYVVPVQLQPQEQNI